mgnify:CR=1 FL=1
MKYFHLEKLKPFITSGLLVLLITLLVSIQIKYDAVNAPFTHKFEAIERTLLPAQIVKNFNFGFSNVIADMYWIRAVQDLVHWNETDSYYVDYFENISTLDSKFEYPYLVGIFVVPTSKSPSFLERISVIADRGIEALPENWQIPFYLSTKYKSITKEYERADHYLSIAVANENAPEVVRTVYNAFKVNQANDRKQVSEMIKVIYNTTEDTTIKKLAAKGIIVNDVTDAGEKAIARFKIRYKAYLQNLAELEQTKLIGLSLALKNVFDVEIAANGSFKIIEKKNQ